MTDITEVFQQNISIVDNAHRASPCYKIHRDAFIRGSYILEIGNTHCELHDSIIIPRKSGEVFAQLSIGLSIENKLVIMFFCEPFGYPTAIYVGSSFEYICGDDDPYEHKALFHKWHSVINRIYAGLLKRNTARTNLGPKIRRIAIGATKQFGHSIINDLNGLYHLLWIVNNNNILSELSIFSTGSFDGLVAKSLDLKKDIFSREDELINFYQSWSWEDKAYFCVRPYGYGLDKDMSRKLGLYDLKKETANLLWINLRATTEARFNSKAFKYTEALANSILQHQQIEEVVFDGLTDIGEFNMDLPRWNNILSHSKSMSKNLEAKLKVVSPQCTFTNIIGEPLNYKLQFCSKIKYLIVPFGSGTWPYMFCENAKAYILTNSCIKNLKSDPSYDFMKIEDSTIKYPININTSSIDSVKRLIDTTY